MGRGTGSARENAKITYGVLFLFKLSTMLHSPNALQDQVELWIYPLDRAIHADTQQRITTSIEGFLPTWQSHGEALHAGVEVKAWGILLYVDTFKAMPSGCAKDTLNKHIQEIGDMEKCNPFAHTHIACVGDSNPIVYSKEAAARALRSGDLSWETLMYDITQRSKGDFAQRPHIAIKQSWLARMIVPVVLCALGILASCSPNPAQYLQNQNYHVAAEGYRKLLKKSPSNPALNYNMAEALRQNNRLIQALPYYEIARSEYPQATLYYAMGVVQLGDYAQAQQLLDAIAIDQLSDTLQQQALLLQRNIRTIERIQSKEQYYAILPLNELNTSYDEYTNYFDGRALYFTSNRPRKGLGEDKRNIGGAYSNIYKVNQQNREGTAFAVNTIEPLPDAINLPNTHVGSMGVAGNKWVFARGNPEKANSPLRNVNLFYLEQRRRGRFSDPILLAISDTSYWDSGPAFSPDGRALYFASNRPGGFGGSDLYKITIDRRGQWGSPINLGEGVNTLGDEAFPQISPNGNLYFSSSGHPGLGGLDLYILRARADSTWVENIGEPLNSSRDDFGIIFRNDLQGYFSSNRNGQDDVYTFENNTPSTITYDLKLIARTLRADSLSTGPILDDATVELLSTTGTILATERSGPEGTVTFPVTPEADYWLRARKKGYLATRIAFTTYNRLPEVDTLLTRKASATYYASLVLDPLVLEQAIVLENIYYDLDKASIRVDARTSLVKLVRLLEDNDHISIELSAHTDTRASDGYNLDLSQRRAESVVDYLVANNISPDRLIAKGYGETRVILENASSEEEHQVNRRTEFKVIEVDKSLEP